MYQDKRVAVIIAAAGSATRMGGGIPKQYIKIGNEMILEKSLSEFSNHPFIDEIYLVVKKEDLELCHSEFIEKGSFSKIVALVSGGGNRQASVFNGLRTIEKSRMPGGISHEAEAVDVVLIHDGARPFVSGEEINRLTEAAARWGAATLGVPVKDSVAEVDGMWLIENLDRSRLYSIQTPQGFLYPMILDAHIKAKKDGYSATDDSSLIRRLGKNVALVPGEYTNIKITTPDDLSLQNQGDHTLEDFLTGTRIGIGFDVHGFVPQRRLVLGGVDIPCEYGLAGYSDADVLIHAVIDSVLGACGMGDIGGHFPDDDPQNRDASSLELLSVVREKIDAEGFYVGNIDVVLVAEKPKIAPYVQEMKNNLADALALGASRINIKGTTTEKLGFCGREEGIAAMSTAAVYRKNNSLSEEVSL